MRGWRLPASPSGAVESLGGSGVTSPVEWLRPAPGEIQRVAAAMAGAREEELVGRPTRTLVAALGRVGRRFLDPGDRLRREALEGLPGSAGVSPAMGRAILDGMAADWTPGRLSALLASEFEDPSVLERFVPRPGGGALRALGDRLLVQVVSGSVPGVSTTALLRGLLARSATLVKPGRGDLLLPLLWMEGLMEEDPGLAGAAGVHYWPGGDPGSAPVEAAWLEAADRVVVYGGEDAVASVRQGTRAPIVVYPHRISVAMVGKEVWRGPGSDTVARDLAKAVSLFDGRGCVSPQLVFVEGSPREVWEWARVLAGAMEEEAQRLPPGALEVAEAARLQQLRSLAELEGAAGDGGVMAGSGTSWTVLVGDTDPLEGVCPGRVLRLVPVPGLEGVPERLRPLAGHLQSAALEVADGRRMALAGALAVAGVSRLTSLEGMAWPPPWWHHDGQGPLRVLVRWAEVEPRVSAG